HAGGRPGGLRADSGQVRQLPPRGRRAAARPARRPRGPRGWRDVTACGVVGAGAIGRGFVASLARAGFPVTVYDLDEAASARAVEAGALQARTLDELGRACEVVLLALPDTPEILAALDGG